MVGRGVWLGPAHGLRVLRRSVSVRRRSVGAVTERGRLAGPSGVRYAPDRCRRAPGGIPRRSEPQRPRGEPAVPRRRQFRQQGTARHPLSPAFLRRNDGWERACRDQPAGERPRQPSSAPAELTPRSGDGCPVAGRVKAGHSRGTLRNVLLAKLGSRDTQIRTKAIESLSRRPARSARSCGRRSRRRATVAQLTRALAVRPRGTADEFSAGGSSFESSHTFGA